MADYENLAVANESSGILHMVREKSVIILAIIVALALGIAVGIAICFAPTIKTEANTAITDIGSKVDLMEMKMHNTSVAVTAALTAIGIQIDLMEMKMHNTSVAADTAMAAFGSQIDVMQQQLLNTSVLCELSAVELRFKSSCAAIHTRLPDAASGVYTIYPAGLAPGRSVWCDMDTDGGGWTRVQHRQDGSVAFNETWAVYQQGFGSPAGEFWFGNDDLHKLTTAQPSELRVDIWDWDGAHGYAKYSSFSVGSQSDNYRLEVSEYNDSSTAGDAMGYNNNMTFSTMDRDHDTLSGYNCASVWGGGGWWYAQCTLANLNGRYYAGGVITHRGVTWERWRGNNYSYKVTSMLTRPR